jgi:hypothetical protein
MRTEIIRELESRRRDAVLQFRGSIEGELGGEFQGNVVPPGR